MTTAALNPISDPARVKLVNELRQTIDNERRANLLRAADLLASNGFDHAAWVLRVEAAN